MVMAIFSVAVTDAARELSHYIAFGVTLAVLLLISAYVWYRARYRYGSRWQRYGPFILTACSLPLIMADLLRHVLQDTQVWPANKGSREYRQGCEKETMECLSVVGWFFTIIFTWSGFVLLIVGTFWNAHLIEQLKKIRDEWRRIMAERRDAKAAAAAEQATKA